MDIFLELRRWLGSPMRSCTARSVYFIDLSLEYFEVTHHERFQIIDCPLKMIEAIVRNPRRDGEVQGYFTDHRGSESALGARHRPTITRPSLYQLLPVALWGHIWS